MLQRARLSHVLAATAWLLSGCCTEHTSTASFAWPASEACPAAEDAAFYMKGFRGTAECGFHLLSIDGEAERVEGECRYPVTTESCVCDLH
jgi:hypothetical protein